MKKILPALIALMLAPAILHAAKGTTLDYPDKLYRSSMTGTGELVNATFATGTFILKAICISSPITNNGGVSYVRIMASSSPVYGTWVSTAAKAGTYATAATPISPGQCFERSVQIRNVVGSTATYTFIDKRGGAEVEFLWDWPSGDMAYPTNSLP